LRRLRTLALVTVASLALSACASVAQSAPPHRSHKDLALTLALGSRRVVAGDPIAGVVTVTNNTTATIPIEACPDEWLSVGVSSRRVPYEPLGGGPFCVASFGLRPGRNVFRVTLSTTYTTCSMNPAITSEDSPRCLSPMRMPSLPAGRYHTRIVIEGVNGTWSWPAPLTVTLTTPR